MSGQPVPAGPFVGGLNTLSDPGAIADVEMVVCDNFEVDPDGALKTRPPFVDTGVDALLGASGDFRLLGTYYDSTGAPRLVAAVGANGTAYFNGTGWTTITSTFAASAVVQFNGVLYLLAPIGVAVSGYWNGTTFTADPNMPHGNAIVAYKSRLWVSTGNSVIQYSSVTPDGNFWTIGGTAGGQFTVNAKDGQSVVGLMVAFGSLLIFRTTSVWQFTYSTDPAYGAQQALVPDVGLSSADALAQFENIIYFMFDGKAYVLNGANATQLNVNVPFRATSRVGIYQPYSVSVVGRRVIYGYYDTQYVWNLRSRTWTTWTSAYSGIGKMLQVSGADTGDSAVYLTASSVSVSLTGTRGASTLFFTDGYGQATEAAPFTARMQTKTYDYGTPFNYKRLFHWGADLIFKSQVTGAVVPVVYATQVTWGQLRAMGRTWGQLLNYTWGQPAVGSFDATTTIPGASAGTAPIRKAVRFGKSLRFQRIYFTLSFVVDGSTTTSPAKVFGIETFVDEKQLVSRQIS